MSSASNNNAGSSSGGQGAPTNRGTYDFSEFSYMYQDQNRNSTSSATQGESSGYSPDDPTQGGRLTSRWSASTVASQGGGSTSDGQSRSGYSSGQGIPQTPSARSSSSYAHGGDPSRTSTSAQDSLDQAIAAQLAKEDKETKKARRGFNLSEITEEERKQLAGEGSSTDRQSDD